VGTATAVVRKRLIDSGVLQVDVCAVPNSYAVFSHFPCRSELVWLDIQRLLALAETTYDFCQVEFALTAFGCLLHICFPPGYGMFLHSTFFYAVVLSRLLTTATKTAHKFGVGSPENLLSKILSSPVKIWHSIFSIPNHFSIGIVQPLLSLATDVKKQKYM